MRVQTFEGINMSEAMKAVKKEFGKDAVILETKESRIDNGKLKIVKVKAASSDAHMNINNENNMPVDFSYGIERVLTSQREMELNIPKRESINQILDTLKDIKLQLTHFNIEQKIKPEKLSISIQEVYQQLECSGLKYQILIDLIKFLEKKQIEAPSEFIAHETAITWLSKKIRIYPQKNNNDFEIHVLVGPNGVGKTQVTSKLANHYKKLNKKVVLASLEKSKVASTEKLGILSKILGVPHYKIENRQRLLDAIQKSKDSNVFILDTEGVDAYQSESIFELKSILKEIDSAEVHLVLSMSEKESYLQKCIQAFDVLSLSSLIFTKLDLSHTSAEILNHSIYSNLCLSYFTDSSSISEPIAKFNKNIIIQKVFGV